MHQLLFLLPQAVKFRKSVVITVAVYTLLVIWQNSQLPRWCCKFKSLVSMPVWSFTLLVTSSFAQISMSFVKWCFDLLSLAFDTFLFHKKCNIVVFYKISNAILIFRFWTTAHCRCRKRHWARRGSLKQSPSPNVGEAFGGLIAIPTTWSNGFV